MSARTPAHVLYVAGQKDKGLLELAVKLATDHRAATLIASGAAQVQTHLVALAGKKELPDVVCLLGPEQHLPYAEFEDDTGNDIAVLTDNDYGMFSSPARDQRYSEAALPDFPVCRIPFSDEAIVRRLLSVRGDLQSSWNNGVAVTCEVWAGASVAVQKQIDSKRACFLDSAPPVDSVDVGDRFCSEVGRVYFNVHGSDQMKYWVGEGAGGYQPVLLPEGVQVGEHAIFVSEACYGARHDEQAGPTIATAALRGGASAFVGSTIIAWGPAEAPIGLADCIVTGVYGGLDSGRTLAAAVLAAKTSIIDKAGSPFSPCVLNTVSSFVAFGGPLASVGGSASARPVRTTDILGRTRQSLRGGGAGPLGAARDRLSARAQRMGYKPVAREILSVERALSMFARADVIQRRLQSLKSGDKAVEVQLLKYQTGSGTEQALMATHAGEGHHLMWIIDRTGRVRETIYSK